MGKPSNRTLWVEVTGYKPKKKLVKTVYLRDGPDVPEPRQHNYFSLFGSSNSMSMKEFTRWSGLDLPVGIHGLEVQMAQVVKARVVKEEVIEPQTRTTYRVVVD